jgi:NDP-sugar pyrophosphorylase family protein
MAAEADLFPRSEFHFPKPLVEIEGRPMIEHVVNNIRDFDPEAEFIFVVRKADCDEFSLDATLRLATDDRCKVVKLANPTMGSACTALMAIEHIDDDRPLVVCNADQVIEADISAINRRFVSSGFDAAVVTFPSVHPRWSFVKLDREDLVAEAAEKRVLSRRAIAGYYFFKTGRSFVASAQQSIRNGPGVGGKHFISPTLNAVVLAGGKVGYHDISETQYQSLYSPQRVEIYERRLEAKSAIKPAKSVQVVIPMAGLGSRFSKAGYEKPKPFIDVLGKPMIERVLDNLKIEGSHFILLARKEHLDAEPEVVRQLQSRGDVTFVSVGRVTEGAACTIALARSVLDRDSPILIANCDQIVDFDCSAYIRDAQERGLDGSILVFKDRERDPKWSFARLGAGGLVDAVAEKVAISDLATVGLYYFATAQHFFDAALDMIALNERVNNEFYVCPVYNYSIMQNRKVGVFEIEASAMHGIGTPEDLNAYIELISR